MSLQIKESCIEIDGHSYPLRCNMSVLEKIQDDYCDGEIGNMYKMQSYQAIFVILKAMIDDACEDDPDLPPVEMKRLKKLFSPRDLGEKGIFKMFVLSMDVLPNEPKKSGAGSKSEPGEPEPSGN